MYVYIHLSHTWTNPDDPRTLSFYVQEIFKDEILWCGSLRSDLETGTLNTIYLSATSVSWSWSWLVRVTTLFQMEAFTIWVNLFSTSQNIDGWFFQQGWFRLVNYYPARFPGRSRIPEHPIGEFAGSIKPDSWGDLRKPWPWLVSRLKQLKPAILHQPYTSPRCPPRFFSGALVKPALPECDAGASVPWKLTWRDQCGRRPMTSGLFILMNSRHRMPTEKLPYHPNIERCSTVQPPDFFGSDL